METIRLATADQFEASDGRGWAVPRLFEKERTASRIEADTRDSTARALAVIDPGGELDVRTLDAGEKVHFLASDGVSVIWVALGETTSGWGIRTVFADGTVLVTDSKRGLFGRGHAIIEIPRTGDFAECLDYHQRAVAYHALAGKQPVAVRSAADNDRIAAYVQSTMSNAKNIAFLIAFLSVTAGFVWFLTAALRWSIGG